MLCIWFQISVEEPEPIDNLLQSSNVDDVENALHEAFSDIFTTTGHTNEVIENASYSNDDTTKVYKTKTFAEEPCIENVGRLKDDATKIPETETIVEQHSIETITSLSILPISIPCSVGSVPTPCAPVLDELWSAPIPKVPFESLTPFTDEQLAEYYQNKLLFGLQEYTEEFNQTELNNFQICEHPLNTLLQDYLHARLKLESTKQEIKESKYSYTTHEKHIWTLEPATYTQYGECQVNITIV